MHSKNNYIAPSLIFPPIRFFKELKNCNNLSIETSETYQKQSFRNRYVIAGPNSILPLIIPVKKINGCHTKTSDIEIDYSTNWINQHLKSLKTAYSVSPFYLYYIDEIADNLQKKHEKLITLNSSMLSKIIKWTNIDCEITFTKTYERNYPDTIDLREHMTQKDNWYLSNYTPYRQIFSDKFNFIPGLSILDLIFNLGPETTLFLKNDIHE